MVTENHDNKNLLEILEHIHPADLDYQEWVNIGMGLKEAGYTASDWDAWSRRDAHRYHQGECFRKWESFRGTSNPITAGTIVQMAVDHGWQPERDPGHELDWDDIIGSKDQLVVIDKNWIEGRDIADPENWEPVEDLVKYLGILFEASENVGYVTESWYDDEKQKYFPRKGCCDRTAGQLIEKRNK